MATIKCSNCGISDLDKKTLKERLKLLPVFCCPDCANKY